jgi:hypothetical protein
MKNNGDGEKHAKNETHSFLKAGGLRERMARARLAQRGK